MSDDSRMSVRDVRAHLAEVLTRAENGSPTVIMRNGEPVAAVVPIEDFNVLEDAIDLISPARPTVTWPRTPMPVRTACPRW